MISDNDMISAVSNIGATGNRPFVVIGVAAQGGFGRWTMRFRIPPRPEIYRLQLPLPSSKELEPWLTHPPSDAAEATHELFSFLTEEIETGVIDLALKKRVDEDFELELSPYGLRLRDEKEHARLLKVAGPHGWWGKIN